MQPIKASYCENADYYVAATEQAGHTIRPGVGIAAGIIAGAIIGFVTHLNREKYWYLWSLFALCIGILFGTKPYQRWMQRRQYGKHVETQNTRVEWEFAEDSICCLAGNNVASRYSWDWPRKIIQKPGGFIIHVSAAIRFWIPRESLASPDDFARLAELMKTKVKDYEVKS